MLQTEMPRMIQKFFASRDSLVYQVRGHRAPLSPRPAACCLRAPTHLWQRPVCPLGSLRSTGLAEASVPLLPSSLLDRARLLFPPQVGCLTNAQTDMLFRNVQKLFRNFPISPPPHTTHTTPPRPVFYSLALPPLTNPRFPRFPRCLPTSKVPLFSLTGLEQA